MDKKEEKQNIDIGKLQKDLENCKAKCEEYLSGWKRERADFINHKKEEMERIEIMIKYANEELILKILPILDNICLAESHVPEEFKNNGWIEGFMQIKKQISDFLAKEGIKPIKTIGEKFDPNTMEAVEEIDLAMSDIAKSEDKKNVVVEEIQRGYTLHGKVIRPAKVKVSK